MNEFRLFEWVPTVFGSWIVLFDRRFGAVATDARGYIVRWKP